MLCALSTTVTSLVTVDDVDILDTPGNHVLEEGELCDHSGSIIDVLKPGRSR